MIFLIAGHILSAILCAAAAATPAHGGSTAGDPPPVLTPQRDTIVIRLDSLDIDKGRYKVETDTIEIRQDVPQMSLSIPDNILEQIPSTAPAISKLPRVLTPEQLDERGDSLMRAYDFASAFNDYAEAYRRSSAPAILQKASKAQNALNLTDFCQEPVVVAREKFPLRDFYLFYPLKSGAWRPAPNQLDSATGPLASATYLPKGEKTLYYSAPDPSGAKSIHVIRSNDTLWTAPRLVNEVLTSTGNEIFPMLSNDGKTLYFASDGLYGTGGYDLYRSDWDETTSDWGEPVNMGFPYSSPGDDFLFIETPDGKYNIFASNRDCSPDSVYLYVLERNPSLPRHSIKDPAALKKTAALIPVVDPTRIDNGSAVSDKMPEAESTREYMEAMAQVRAIRDTLYKAEKALNAGAAAILKDSLAKVQARVKKIEGTFLGNGVVFDSNQLRETSDREVVGAASAYAFSKNIAGGRLRLKFAPGPSRQPFAAAVSSVTSVTTGPASPTTTAVTSEPASPTATAVTSEPLPDGIVYQILLFTSSARAAESQFAGLAPIYETLTPSLKYNYSAGVFRTYAEALDALVIARAHGFTGATITALHNHRPITVTQARTLE